MKTIAVILASGIGKRFDKKLIKQYQYINNKAVILHSTKVFYDNPNIDKVVLVINKKYQNITKICLEELATIDFAEQLKINVAMYKKKLLGVQFHPEKSQKQGLELIRDYFQFNI